MGTMLAALVVAAVVFSGLGMEPDRRAESSPKPKRTQGAMSLAAMADEATSSVKQYLEEKATSELEVDRDLDPKEINCHSTVNDTRKAATATPEGPLCYTGFTEKAKR